MLGIFLALLICPQYNGTAPCHVKRLLLPMAILDNLSNAGMYRGHGLGGNKVYPAIAPMPERFTHTHCVVEQAIRFLIQRDPECPFFLLL